MKNFNNPIAIKHNNFTYHVSSSPNPNNVEHYKDFFIKNDVFTIVRLCEKLYNAEFFMMHHMKIFELEIEDGHIPSNEIIDEWIKIINNLKKYNQQDVFIHCRSGLGRAPMMICIALIMIDDYDPYDAIKKIRSKIKGALNSTQIKFICNINKKKHKLGCVIA